MSFSGRGEDSFKLSCFFLLFPWILSNETSTSLFAMDSVLRALCVRWRDPICVKLTQALRVPTCISIEFQKDQYYIQHFIDRWIQPIFQKEFSVLFNIKDNIIYIILLSQCIYPYFHSARPLGKAESWYWCVCLSVCVSVCVSVCPPSPIIQIYT